MFKFALACGLTCAVTVTTNADWYQVAKSTHPITLETSGTLVSTDVLGFTPPPSFYWNLSIGQIVREGQRVQPGDLLVRFEGTQEDERLRESLQELTDKRGELTALLEKQNQDVETEKLDLAEAESNLDKAQRKAEQPADLIPSVEYRKLVEQRHLAEKIVANLRRRGEASKTARDARRRTLEVAVKRLGLVVAVAEKDKNSLIILAPKPGLAVIGTTYNMEKFDVGSTTQPNYVIVELVDKSLEVQGHVREKDAAQLALNQLVRMELETAGGLAFTGKIASLGNSVRRKSRHSLEMVRDFTVEIDQQLEDATLGSAVRIVIEVNRRTEAIALPIDSIRYRDGTPRVVTRSGWREVRLGERSNGTIIVVDGLLSEDFVAI